MTYIALSLGADPVYIGIQASCFAAGGVAAALPGGRMSDRIGGALVASIGMVLLLMGIALILVLPTLPVLLGTSFIIGAGHALMVVGQQSLVARVASTGSRDAAFGTLSATMAFGQLVGAPLVTTLGTVFAAPHAEINTTVGMITCAATIGVALLPTLALHRIEAAAFATGPPTERIRLRAALGIPGMWRALVVSGTVLAGVDLLASFLPVWAVERGVTAAVVGWLLALRALVTITSRFGMTRLIGRFGRRALLTVAIVVAAVAMGALPFVDAWGAVVVMCLMGIGLGLPQPLTLSWVTSLAPPTARGVVLATRVTANRLAQVTIPLIVSTIAGPSGVSAVLISTAGVLAISAGFAASSGSLRPEGPSDSLDRETPDVPE